MGLIGRIMYTRFYLQSLFEADIIVILCFVVDNFLKIEFRPNVQNGRRKDARLHGLEGSRQAAHYESGGRTFNFFWANEDFGVERVI